MKRKQAMENKLGQTRQNEKKGAEDDWEDIDEHERDVFDKDGYFDVLEEAEGISGSDLQLLEKFSTKKTVTFSTEESKGGASSGGGVNLADLIAQKMAAGDYEDGDKEIEEPNQIDTMDPKIVAAY